MSLSDPFDPDNRRVVTDNLILSSPVALPGGAGAHFELSVVGIYNSKAIHPAPLPGEGGDLKVRNQGPKGGMVCKMTAGEREEILYYEARGS